MKRFLEYDIASGKIICELYAEDAPSVAAGHSLLEIGEDLNLDTNNCAVRDGVVARLYETPEEIRERERLRKEYKEKALSRIKGLIFDFTVAQIEDDKPRQKELRAEYAKLKKMV